MLNKNEASRFLINRRRLIAGFFGQLNEMQKQAVLHTDGPLLILAGAGSGKTTVLTHRIVNLLTFGDGYQSCDIPTHITPADVEILERTSLFDPNDKAVLNLLQSNVPQPWQIMAITFTNKAAGEMRVRLQRLLGKAGSEVAASTFHSACLNILRREISKVGYRSDFVIYDADDSVRVIKEALKQCKLDDRILPAKSVLAAIGEAKDLSEDPTAMRMRAVRKKDFRAEQISRIYEIYQKRLESANAIDFDDIIALAVKLFEQHPDVLKKYQDRIHYLLVDEYQDTNRSQYRFVSLLAQSRKNLCVVGDDDQSIYRFRGATIENILSFEEHYPLAKVIRLEQNYRSTQMILNAANSVIAKNPYRKEKKLWTASGDGNKVMLWNCESEQDEANTISEIIAQSIKKGFNYSDHAVLYRVNAQSAAIETALMAFGIPYKVIGGTRFFDRKEIKDILAYLSVINNPRDSLRLVRIINEPKRGIGDATISSAKEIAELLGVELFEVLSRAEEYAPLARRAHTLKSFSEMITRLMNKEYSLSDLVDELLNVTGYKDMLRVEGVQGQTRLENIEELKSSMLRYEQETEEPSLTGFLEEVALYSDMDQYENDENFVTLMTLHSAKGLEFPVVFLPGMEEGICPSERCLGNQEEIEEERRLTYVGITRAKKQLYVLAAKRRTLYGRTQYGQLSRFIRDVPESVLSQNNTDRTLVQPNTFAIQKIYRSADSLKVGQSTVVPKKQVGPVLAAGMRVIHRVFGTGIIEDIKPMGGDRLLQIRFDAAGTKKVMETYAQLKIDNQS